MTESTVFPSWGFCMVLGDARIKAGVPIKCGDIDRAAVLLSFYSQSLHHAAPSAINE